MCGTHFYIFKNQCFSVPYPEIATALSSYTYCTVYTVQYRVQFKAWKTYFFYFCLAFSLQIRLASASPALKGVHLFPKENYSTEQYKLSFFMGGQKKEEN